MKLLIQHNQEIVQLSPDPFPLLRAGSGDETTYACATHCTTRVSSVALSGLVIESLLYRVRASRGFPNRKLLGLINS